MGDNRPPTKPFASDWASANVATPELHVPRTNHVPQGAAAPRAL